MKKYFFKLIFDRKKIKIANTINLNVQNKAAEIYNKFRETLIQNRKNQKYEEEEKSRGGFEIYQNKSNL